MIYRPRCFCISAHFNHIPAFYAAACTLSSAESQLFPRPPELEPAVRFWTRIYTEVDTQSGFLHDARNLAVVYDRMPLDRRQIENRRNQIQTDLRVLAGGKRSGLSEGQREILALWPEDVGNKVLREAVDSRFSSASRIGF